MQIIDITSNVKFYPIGIYNNKIICKEIERKSLLSNSPYEVKCFYEYDIDKKLFKKLSSNDEKIYYYRYFDKSANTQNCIYYLMNETHTHYNTYTLYRIELKSGKEEKIYVFDVYEKYDVEIVPLNERYFLSFYREQKNSLDVKGRCKNVLNHNEACLFDIQEHKKYKVMDRNLVYGFKNILLQTKIKDVMHLIFEETYLEAWEKEEIFNRFDVYKKKKRIFNDSIRIIPFDDFISEVKIGRKKLTFNILDSKGFNGIVAFKGITSSALFYIVKNFDDNNEKLVIVDKKNLKKKEIVIQYEDNDEVMYQDIIYNIKASDKRIVHQIFYDNKVYNKELFYGNKEFVYDFKFGRASDFIEGRYMITNCIKGKEHKKYTAIIDTETNVIKEYEGESEVFDNVLVIY
ncbi:hypothetical protein CLTEP_08800 [Clostridium tepidiprofundi DSM 19306]|uniref:Uncharacterized protein n=1 Tax=Clostridium tepidiprofundi DSM 19306 TaxID=1121338 RepID=A0A151B5R1_9CLOT|nr:hypothetical protein [Clostridium tepidiprofundi]KYH35255.1 hypothetical protein CLTEP_08800 [Clostridium tepidiprofundi DSM 19306]